MSSEKQVLECPACMQPYDEEDCCPRRLSCGHTFCTCCLRQMLKGSSISCPQDRSNTLVTEGVTSLPRSASLLRILQMKLNVIDGETSTSCEVCSGVKHVAVSYCEDCKQAMCQAMLDAHINIRAIKSHCVIPLAKVKKDAPVAAKATICLEHDQPYSYFDSECQSLICVDCARLSHSSHKCQSLREAAVEYQNKVDAFLIEARNKATQVKKSREWAADVLRLLGQNYQVASQSLKLNFESVVESLAARRRELSTQMHDIYIRKSASLDEQIKELDTLHARLCSAVAKTSQSKQLSTDLLPFLLDCMEIREVLRLTKCSNSFELPRVDECLLFTGDSGTLTGMIQELGWIYDKGIMVENCQLIPSGFNWAPWRGDGSFSIEIKDIDATTWSDETQFCVDVDVKDKGKFPAKIVRKGPDKYDVEYSGIVGVGERKVSVFVRGAHIQGSPFVAGTFFDLTENLVVDEAFFYKSSEPESLAWARSKSLVEGCIEDLDIFYEVPVPVYKPIVTTNSTMRILLFDQRCLGNLEDPSQCWKASDALAICLNYKPTAKRNGTDASGHPRPDGKYEDCTSIKINFEQKICILDGEEWSSITEQRLGNKLMVKWEGFLKLCIVMPKGGRFSVRRFNARFSYP